VVLAPVMALVVLSGCGTQRTPTKYSDSVRKNFVEACQGKNRDQSSNVSASSGTCRCAYGKISSKFKFSRFKKVNDQLTDKPGPLPRDFQTIVDACASDAGPQGATTEPAKTTTSAPG